MLLTKILLNFKFQTLLVVLMSTFLTSACDLFPRFLRRTDNEIKKHYYEHAAEKEDIEAMYLAAKANCCGEDKFSDNDIKALNMFCKAAKQGHKASMVEVGKLYLNENTIDGTVIPHDPGLAFTFFTIADENGYKHAEYYRQKLLDELSDDEFSRATSLISNFPVVPCELTR